MWDDFILKQLQIGSDQVLQCKRCYGHQPKPWSNDLPVDLTWLDNALECVSTMGGGTSSYLISNGKLLFHKYQDDMDMKEAIVFPAWTNVNGEHFLLCVSEISDVVFEIVNMQM